MEEGSRASRSKLLRVNVSNAGGKRKTLKALTLAFGSETTAHSLFPSYLPLTYSHLTFTFNTPQ